MKPRLSSSYIENLFASGAYDALTEILAFLVGSHLYNPQQVDYGLGGPIFVFAESLLWFSQATRSGSVTYFEVAPLARQELMERKLSELAPPGFSAAYAAGRSIWSSSSSFDSLDNWMEQNDQRNNQWLAVLIRDHRAAFESAVLAP